MGQMLLDKGADVNATGGEYGSALQAASYQGHESVARLLLNNGANVNVSGGEYGSAREIASSRGHEGVTQLLQAATQPQYFESTLKLFFHPSPYHHKNAFSGVTNITGPGRWLVSGANFESARLAKQTSHDLRRWSSYEGFWGGGARSGVILIIL